MSREEGEGSEGKVFYLRFLDALRATQSGLGKMVPLAKFMVTIARNAAGVTSF